MALLEHRNDPSYQASTSICKRKKRAYATLLSEITIVTVNVYRSKNGGRGLS